MKRAFVCSRLFGAALTLFCAVVFTQRIYAKESGMVSDIIVVAPPCHSCTGTEIPILVPPPLMDTIYYSVSGPGKLFIDDVSSGSKGAVVTDTAIVIIQRQPDSFTYGPLVSAMPDGTIYSFVRWSDGSMNPIRQDSVPVRNAGRRGYTAFFQENSVIEDNLITGSFDNPMYPNPDSKWTLEAKIATCQAMIPECFIGTLTENDEYKFKIPMAGGVPEDVRLTRSNIFVEEGKDYELKFMARSDAPRTVVVSVDLSDFAIENWEVELTPEVKEYSKTFLTPSRVYDYILNKQNCYDGAIGQLTNCVLPPMAVSVSFSSGHEAVNWYLSDVSLAKASEANSVKPSINRGRAAGASAWSLKRTGGSLQLSGPSGVNAAVSLYDIRGKLVQKVSAKTGPQQAVTLGIQKVPAGTYFVVVRNKVSGGELFRSKVTLAK